MGDRFEVPQEGFSSVVLVSYRYNSGEKVEIQLHKFITINLMLP